MSYRAKNTIFGMAGGIPKWQISDPKILLIAHNLFNTDFHDMVSRTKVFKMFFASDNTVYFIFSCSKFCFVLLKTKKQFFHPKHPFLQSNVLENSFISKSIKFCTKNASKRYG
jgi:hypothetical protein